MSVYKKSFIEAFDIEESEANSSFRMNSKDEWDSIGHMTLIAILEEAYGVSFETSSIIDFDSFDKGVEILSSMGVSF
jgi:acyl carrier protein